MANMLEPGRRAVPPETSLKTAFGGPQSNLQLCWRLSAFESVPHEEWAETEDLFEVGNRFARAMLAVNPSFRRRGMCVAIYDEAGIAVSVMPLDTLQ